MTTLNVATLTAALASVPAATVAEAHATVARRKADAATRRHLPVLRTLSEWSHPSDAVADALPPLSWVLSTVSRMMIGRTGRTVTLSDILPDGASTVEDVRADAYGRALDTWTHLNAHAAGTPCENDRCKIGSDIVGGVLAQALTRSTVPVYVYARAARCGVCEGCTASVDATVKRAEPTPSTGRAYGRQALPVAANVPGRFANVGACESPVSVQDVVTLDRAARRGVYSAAADALMVQGDKTFGRRGFRAYSLDSESTPAHVHADVAVRHGWTEDAQQLPEDVRTLFTAIVATVGDDAVIARNGRPSDAAWKAFATLMGTSTGEHARETMRRKLTALRNGEVTLSDIVASVPA